MAVYALGDQVPVIDATAFVSEQAIVIGSVTIGAGASIWPGAVLRADFGAIVIGAQTSVQDNVVMHSSERAPTLIGERCTIGHLAHLEGCTVEDDVLIGALSAVLTGARIGRGALVAASALVPGSLVVPAYARAIGVPARIVLDAYAPDRLPGRAAVYVANGVRYAEQLRRIE
jgi:carbonic anhydrase/acetyltransferase-like protein (isoleucine patch superfamily)